MEDDLTPAQAAVLEALLRSETLDQAAQAGGVTTRTLHNWLTKDTSFRRAWRDSRRELLEQVVARLQRAARPAVATLEAGLDAEKFSDRLKAALTILKCMFLGAEVMDLADRVEELELLASKRRKH